ncbi:hypothetical protein [Streptomyces filipinensis]|uniref:hypothetical protein n=1 Tax=Streptomyces TaxID=1883 RepID=UPI00068F5692
MFRGRGQSTTGCRRRLPVGPTTDPVTSIGGPRIQPGLAPFARASRIGPGHAVFADRPAQVMGETELAEAVRLLERLSAGREELGKPVTEP